jgi:TctA family transporter
MIEDGVVHIVGSFEWIDFIHVMGGILAGFLAGLIPGIGNTIMLFMLYPFLMESTLFQMLVFYLGLASVSQFSGSVIATVFGIPGESSSLPQ